MPRDNALAGAETDKRLKANAGFEAEHVIFQFVHGELVAGKRLEGAFVQTFLPGRHAVLVLCVQAFDLLIGIALKSDEAVEGSGAGRNFAVTDEYMIADSDIAAVKADGDGLVGFVAAGEPLACVDEVLIDGHEFLPFCADFQLQHMPSWIYD